jgi:hypothetical protein
MEPAGYRREYRHQDRESVGGGEAVMERAGYLREHLNAYWTIPRAMSLQWLSPVTSGSVSKLQEARQVQQMTPQ